MKRLTVLIGSLALAGTGVVAAATPALANPCPSGATCAYSTTNWGGTAYDVYEDNSNLTPYYGWTHAESIYNNGRYCNVYIYSATGYGGTRYPLNRGTGWRTISGSAIWHHAYSNKWYGC